MTRRRSSLFALALVGCGESTASTPPAPPPEVTPVITAAPEAPTPPVVAPIELPTSPPLEVVGGDVYELSPVRYDDGRQTLLVAIEDAPRPSGRVVAYAETHHSHWEFREIEALASPPYPTAVVVSHRNNEITLCASPIRRARRLHATSVDDDAESDEATDTRQTTFLALELSACPRGDLAIAGVPLADISTRSLQRTSLSEHAPLELADLVLDRDAIYAEAHVAAADFRTLALPAYNLTIVVGENAWLVREGRVLSMSGNPSYVVQAGPRAFFWVDSPSESWSESLDCAHPTYAPGTCEVVDESGTPTNVRAAPSGRSAVLTTVMNGTTIAADDQIGSWYRLLTTPPGWVHASGLRCTPLPPHQATCL